MTYKYGMRLRGFSIGCQPKGVIERMDDPSGRYYDILAYDRQLTEKELEDYELDDLNEGSKTMARKYYIVDCISGYHDEEDECFTKIADARAKRDEMNAQRVAEGGSADFWTIIDGNGKEIP